MEANELREWGRSLAVPGVLKRHAALVALLALAGALAGTFAAAWMPRTYEAVATVKVGWITQPSLGSKPIELPQDAAQRVRTAAFLRQAGSGAPPEELDRRLVSRRLRDTSFVEIRYRDASPQAAEAGLAAIVEHLRKQHEEMARPVRSQVTEELRQVKELKAASGTRRAEVLQKAGSDLGRSQVGEILANLTYTQNELELRRWDMVLSASLEEPWASSTELAEPIRSYESSRAFRMLLSAVVGFIVGLGLGVLVARRLDARRGAAG